MQKRMIRWVAAGMVALALGFGLVAGGSHPTTAYGADPTPTASGNTPGGSGGGH